MRRYTPLLPVLLIACESQPRDLSPQGKEAIYKHTERLVKERLLELARDVDELTRHKQLLEASERGPTAEQWQYVVSAAERHYRYAASLVRTLNEAGDKYGYPHDEQANKFVRSLRKALQQERERAMELSETEPEVELRLRR